MSFTLNTRRVHNGTNVLMSHDAGKHSRGVCVHFSDDAPHVELTLFGPDQYAFLALDTEETYRLFRELYVQAGLRVDEDDEDFAQALVTNPGPEWKPCVPIPCPETEEFELHATVWSLVAASEAAQNLLAVYDEYPSVGWTGRMAEALARLRATLPPPEPSFPFEEPLTICADSIGTWYEVNPNHIPVDATGTLTIYPPVEGEDFGRAYPGEGDTE